MHIRKQPTHRGGDWRHDAVGGKERRIPLSSPIPSQHHITSPNSSPSFFLFRSLKSFSCPPHSIVPIISRSTCPSSPNIHPHAKSGMLVDMLHYNPLRNYICVYVLNYLDQLLRVSFPPACLSSIPFPLVHVWLLLT